MDVPGVLPPDIPVVIVPPGSNEKLEPPISLKDLKRLHRRGVGVRAGDGSYCASRLVKLDSVWCGDERIERKVSLRASILSQRAPEMRRRVMGFQRRPRPSNPQQGLHPDKVPSTVILKSGYIY